MQALGMLPSNLDSMRVSHVEIHLGFSCFEYLNKGSRKKSHFAGAMFAKRTPGVVLVSRTFSSAGHGDLHRTTPRSHVGLGFYSRVLRGNVAFLGGRGKGALVALAWALEDQIAGDDLGRQDYEGTLGQLSHECGHSGDVFCDLNDMSGNNEMHFDGNGNFDHEDGGESIRNNDSVEENGSVRFNGRELAESLKFVKSVEDVEEALRDKGEIPLQYCSSMIRVLGQENKLDVALAVMEWLHNKAKENDGFDGPNVFVYNSLIGAVKQTKQFEKAEEVMNDMARNGITANIITYNTLMYIYLEQERFADALSLFEDLQNKGLSPSVSSYSTAILAYRRMDDGIGAIKLFCMVKEKVMKGELGQDDSEDWATEFLRLRDFTGRVCYQVMRQWLVRADNMSTDVLKLLMYMDEAGIPLSKQEHERLIWACSREEHYTVVREFYMRLRENNYEVKLAVCNHAIWLMGKAKKWWAALEVYEDLLEKGPKPNNLTQELIMSHFNVLLTAARKRGIWRWGVRLLNKMEEKGLKPGNKEWNAVLLACSRSSETAAAVQVFRMMVDQGLKPTIVSYGALLSALEKGKQYEKAIQVWEHMRKIGIKPNIYTYTILATINIALGKFHVVDLILQEMASTGNDATVVTYNAIISACARNGWGGAAYEWFNKMKAQYIPADETTYEMLIEALAKDAKPKMAYEMYLSAHKEGLFLASKAYDAVIQSSETAGASIDRSLMGPRPAEMKKYGAEPKVV